MDTAKYEATMAKIRSEKIVAIGEKPDRETDSEPSNKAFAYINAAKNCAAQFIDSPATMAVLNCLASYADYSDGTCFPGYETIAHCTGYSSSSTIAAALDRLVAVGVLHRCRRFDISNKYTLVLPKMLYLRKPRLTTFQEKVLKRVNKCILNANSEPGDALTHNIILCMKENDKVIWEVLHWYCDVRESGRKHEGIPETVGGSIDSWGSWLTFMQGIRKEVGGKVKYYSGYPEIRRAYFKWKGADEPHLNWPTQDKDGIKYIEHWYGFSCQYCHKEHLGGCDPIRVKYVQSLKKCKNRKCKETIFPEEGEHACKADQKEVAETEEAPDVALAPVPGVVKPIPDVKPLAAEALKAKTVVPDAIKAPVPPASVIAPASIPAPFNNAPAPSVPVQPEIIKTFLCNICHKRVEYPHTHCPAALKADSEARAAEKAAKQDECAQRLKCEVRKNKPQIEATEEFSAYYFSEYFSNDDDEYMVEPVDDDERIRLEVGWQKDFASYFVKPHARTLHELKQLIELAKDDSDFTRLIRNQIASTAATLFLKYMDNVRKDDPNDDLGEVETESEDESDSGEETFDLNEY